MSTTLTISTDGLREAERERLRSVVETCRRNRQIRATYEQLRPGLGKWGAIDKLAAEHCISSRQVRRIIYDD